MRKVWIEAALNGAWNRKFQPGIPDTVEAIIAEGVACACRRDRTRRGGRANRAQSRR
jgi:hypothetical protein